MNEKDGENKEAYIIYIKKRTITLNSSDLLKIMEFIRRLDESKKSRKGLIQDNN